MAEKENHISPIKATNPDVKKIACKDCKHRNKNTIKIGNKIIPVGTTKDYCEKYVLPPSGSGKPIGVLFNNEPCPEYEKE